MISIINQKPEVMKRYIIIFVMLGLAFGLNAQTDRGGRTAPASTGNVRNDSDEKKSAPATTETRTREAAPSNSEPRVRESAPARTAPAESRPQPVYNESRNRETPAVRPTTTTRAVEQERPKTENNSNQQTPVVRPTSPRNADSPSTENRNTNVSNSRNENTPRAVEQDRSRSVNEGDQEPQRRPASNSGTSRENENRNSGSVRPQGGDRNVGTSRETNVERNNREYVPRTEPVYVEKRQAYRTPERPRTVRKVNPQPNYVYHPVEYRRTYYPYAEPRRVDIIWDVHMYNEYRYIYPQYDYWYYPYGYRIHTVSAYDAGMYIGEVARIYGRVVDVWYERQTDEYYLFFGERYPYQDFSVIIPGKTARRYSYRPERYFINRNIAVTGLVSLWDNRPEMLIRKRSQIDVYF